MANPSDVIFQQDNDLAYLQEGKEWLDGQEFRLWHGLHSLLS